MESGTVGDSSDDLNSRQSRRWTGNCIVYTRRIHKKTHKTSNNNNDTATTKASSAAAAAPENPTTTSTPTPTKVSSATVASASTAEVSTASTSKDHNGSAVVSTTSTAPCGCQSAGDGFVPDSVEALEARTADSCQPRIWDESLHQEQRPPRDSGDIVVDYSFQAPQLSEGNCSARRQGQEDSCSSSAELQNSEDSALENRDKAETLKKSSALHGQNDKMLQKCGDKLRNLNESCLCPVGIACLMLGMSCSDNRLANVNGFYKPLAISTFEGRVRFKLAKATSKNEIKKIQKLECG